MPHFPNTMYLLYTYFFFKVDQGRIQTFLKEVANRGTQTQRLNFIENGRAPPPPPLPKIRKAYVIQR
jgi:hypothetical protein